MVADTVTLVVKAPNQQIEDQTIECQLSWTVLELKSRLSEVYPSKPTTEEQKIIYSGQLLEDNSVLKNILRCCESQSVHTVHLVCKPRKMAESQTPKVDANDGLRRRNVDEARPETRQNDQNHSVEMHNYLNSIVNNYGIATPTAEYSQAYAERDPARTAYQMWLMHHTYLQYMQMYSNQWQAIGNPPTAPTPVPEPAAPPQPAPAQPPQQPDDGEDGLAARDWLDNVYAASRLGILFSLVYLYGSPTRLLLVLVLVAAVYLYQIGFFRDLRPVQNQQRENRPNVGDQQQQPPGNQANRQESEQVYVPHPPREESFLSITRMIFTTFFTSLIPDVN